MTNLSRTNPFEESEKKRESKDSVYIRNERLYSRLSGKELRDLVGRMTEKGYNIVFYPIEPGSGRAYWRFLKVSETIEAPGHIICRGCRFKAFKEIAHATR